MRLQNNQSRKFCGKCKGQIGEILKCTLGDEFVAAKPTGICACTDLTRDEIVTQIRAKGLKHQKKFVTYLILKIKMVVQNVAQLSTII